jgi:hypothetical protein
MASESSIENRCRIEAKKAGGILLKVQKQRGWPDRVLLMPGGWTAWIEFKRDDGGIVSPFQDYILHELKKLGHRSMVIDNVADFKELLDEHKSWSANMEAA